MIESKLINAIQVLGVSLDRVRSARLQENTVGGESILHLILHLDAKEVQGLIDACSSTYQKPCLEETIER